MKTAFLFPGQASQYVGMGKDLYEKYEQAQKLFDRAQAITGIDLKRFCFEGPEEELKKTHITQPAIFVHSMAVFTILQDRNMQADGVAGHSLGEYSALVAAGALSFEDGLRLVTRRGRLMYEAGQQQAGSMAAIIGLQPEQVYEICEQVKEEGIVQPANFNSPGQIAVSGEVKAVRAAIEKAKESGAKKAVELVVSGAFHSPLMQGAQEGLQKALDQTEIKTARIPVYSNVEAKPVRQADEIRRLLFSQLSKPVLWQNLILEMIKDGFDRFYEIGPGKVLKGLQKRIDRNFLCTEIGTAENLEKLGDA